MSKIDTIYNFSTSETFNLTLIFYFKKVLLRDLFCCLVVFLFSEIILFNNDITLYSKERVSNLKINS